MSVSSPGRTEGRTDGRNEGSTAAEAAHPSPGYRATVWALALGQVLSWAVLYYAFSSLVLPMDTALGWGQPLMMGALTLSLAVWGAATYAVGAAIDAGHGRGVMVWGSVAAGLGTVAWSQVTQPWMLYPVFALLGAAMAATLYEPAFAVLTKRYPTRYRDGITTLTLVGGFASTLSFPAVAALFKAGLDWRQVLLVLGGVMLAVALLHAWALRGPMVVAGPAHEDPEADTTLHEALRHPSFWLLALCFMLYALAQAALWAHVMPAFADKGVSAADALLVVMTVGPAQVAGRLLYAWFGRRWSLRVLGAGVLAAMPAAMALFAVGRSLGALLLFAAIFGIANGLVTIVRGGLIPEYFGRSHVGRIGGLMSGIGLLARAAAPIAATALLLVLPGYRELMLVLAGLGVLAVVAFWAARQPVAPRAGLAE
jgi:MFS family permease